MSTTATAKIYSAAQIQRGPADLWINVAKPASPSHILTLDIPTGTPDATANPNALHLGLMDSASTLTYTPKPDMEKADQDTSTIAVFDNEEEAVIEVTMKQIGFIAVMQHCLPGLAFSDGTIYEGIALGRGGNILRTPQPIAVIAPSADPAYAWTVGLLYAATPVSAVQVELARSKSLMYKVKFQGVSDLTRPSGDRLGSVYRTNI